MFRHVMPLAVVALFSASVGRAAYVTELASGAVSVALSVEPDMVRLDRDIVACLRVTAPSGTKVEWPALTDRFQGFALTGTYDLEPVKNDGTSVIERRIKLTPLVAAEYRLAPLAVAFTDMSRSPPTAGWVLTRPFVFKTEPVVPGDVGDSLRSKVSTVWIAPPFRTVVLWIALCLAGAGLLWLLWRLLRRVKEQVRILRMSPKERAFHELARLLARDLVRQNQVKEFYLELTMIVRRYVERAHGIRAPEQTTEEFLYAASRDGRFGPEVIRRLRDFLQSADLVKFAAYHPSAGVTDQATETARNYIQTDAGTEASAQAGKPKES
jgi:hypothetical protein